MQFLKNLDESAFLQLHSLAGHSSFIDWTIIFCAEYVAYILPVVFLWFLWSTTTYEKRERVVTLFVVGFSSLFARFGVASIIRFFYHRPRPFLTFDIQPLFPETSFSFPSGHASFFFAFAFTLYLYDKKWGTWFLIATVIMTTARVVAGVHYPSDIIGGMIVGVLTACLTFRYLGPLFKRVVSRFI